MLYVRWKTKLFKDGVEILDERLGWLPVTRSAVQAHLNNGGSVHMNPKNYYINGIYYND
jgi:hypothetical protein